jgi:hypothetical protein
MRREVQHKSSQMESLVTSSIETHMERQSKLGQAMIAEVAELRALTTLTKDTLYAKFKTLRTQVEQAMQTHVEQQRKAQHDLDVKCTTTLARISQDIVEQHEQFTELQQRQMNEFDSRMQITCVELDQKVTESRRENLEQISALQKTTDAEFNALRAKMSAREAIVDAALATGREDVSALTTRMTEAETHQETYEVQQDVKATWDALTNFMQVQDSENRLEQRLSATEDSMKIRLSAVSNDLTKMQATTAAQLANAQTLVTSSLAEAAEVQAATELTSVWNDWILRLEADSMQRSGQEQLAEAQAKWQTEHEELAWHVEDVGETMAANLGAQEVLAVWTDWCTRAEARSEVRGVSGEKGVKRDSFCVCSFWVHAFAWPRVSVGGRTWGVEQCGQGAKQRHGHADGCLARDHAQGHGCRRGESARDGVWHLVIRRDHARDLGVSSWCDHMLARRLPVIRVG